MPRTIDWDVTATATSYEVESAAVVAGPFAAISESPVVPNTVIHALGDGTLFYRVRALNAFGSGAYSIIAFETQVAAADICEVIGTLVDVSGTPLASKEVKVILSSPLGDIGNFQLSSTNATQILTNSQGIFNIKLIQNSKLTIANTRYRFEFPGTGRSAESVVIPVASTANYDTLVRVAA